MLVLVPKPELGNQRILFSSLEGATADNQPDANLELAVNMVIKTQCPIKKTV
jgi:hypothetical protein